MQSSLIEDLRSRLNLNGIAKPAMVGIAIVFVMVAALTAGRLLEAAAATDFEVTHAVSQSGSASAEEGADEQTSASTVFVHVSGAVARPGLVEIAGGSRVADAVEAAGGFAEDALIDSVNLARVVNDGEQIRIASAQETQGGGGAVEGAPGAGPGGYGSYEGSVSGVGAQVNINTATADELVALPGIGQATAQKIIADRESNGPFKTTEDLKRVTGIGDKKYESLADSICV